MISPIGVGQGLDVGTATGLELSIAIARNAINKKGQIFSHPTMTLCRIYCAMYDMSPKAEQMYLSKLSTKFIKYNDYLSIQTLNISPNGNF
jgi:CO dehydrogenase/acetyl-CoA synthase gamma subunit (corrinoid Fe-S protein)